MSGLLGAIATAGLALESAPLVLGSLVLTGHEVPARITLGGRQITTTHRLPGGGRIIDVMGAEDGSIAWTAIFIGPLAAERARAVDTMRQAGVAVALSFGDYSSAIIISQFDYDYAEQGAVIRYRIRGETVGTASTGDTAAATLDYVVQQDLAASATLLGAGVAAVAASGSADGATTAQASMVDSTATTVTSSAAQAALGTLTSAVTSSPLAASLDTAAASLTGEIGLLLPADSSNTALDFGSASALATTVGQAGLLAAIVQAGGYLNRANNNLAAASGQTFAPLISA